MASVGVRINVLLMVLNLLPIPPLDGGRIAVSLLPNPLAASFARIEPYGFMVVIILLASGMLNRLMDPFIVLVEHGLQALVGF